MASLWKNRSKSKVTTKKIHAGEVRQSQLITTFGVGSIVNFVSDTVMIAGTDDWDSSEKYRITNENLHGITNTKYFVKPKTDNNSNFFLKSEDIPAYRFPEKFWCSKCTRILDVKELENGKNTLKCLCGAKQQLVPSRFIITCENGHIEDFPYSWWVHRRETCSSGKKSPRIRMYNADGRSGIDSLRLKCDECGKSTGVAGAFAKNAFSGENGYLCNSNFPHLKNPTHFNDNKCTAPLKAMLRSSTSVYFPVIVSALSIPPWSKEAVKIVSDKYDEIVDSLEDVKEGREDSYLSKKFSKLVTSNISLENLFSAYEIVKSRREIHTNRSVKTVYQDEYNELSKGECCDEDGEFSTFLAVTPEKYKPYFDRIIVVEKLTEVQALYGFTRIQPSSGQLDDERIVPLSIEKKAWLPAVQMNGEGIFVKFNIDKIREWAENVRDRYENLSNRFRETYFRNERFSTEYILLHSFAHLLIRQLAAECGYGVASLKEKIYSTFHDEEPDNVEMAGVLIYLTSSDADGSLGGLISIVSETAKFEKILDNALKKAMWCSADPLCISSKEQGLHALNYSACHDCLLLPETSCEFKNILLDRVSLIGTNENRSLGFFDDFI